MLTEDFYNIIDAELDLILDKYKNDTFIQKHSKSSSNQKAYSFLIWFLEFYGKTEDYLNYITDGNDDSSCDIIFSQVDNQNKKVFYIIQSKWNKLENCNKEIEKKEVLQALNDFDTFIRGYKEKINDKVKLKYDELKEHLKQNGAVKFIYLTLCNKNSSVNDNVKNFIENNKKTEFEFYDINKLKINYIEKNYKGIDPQNPLDTHYNPEEEKITLKIERLNRQSENIIRIEKPFEAYLCLIKPKIIFELFEKYAFSLFFKNVRNPLIKSNFNKEIEQTAIDNPAYFWYYNNGITAITYILPDEIRAEAEEIEVTGLQIINGAQTVYSIYKAYKEANSTKREIMDKEALVTLRLIKSGGRDFDLNVTRYTNSQNPITDRDFKANDDIQIKLQNESFNTNFWYEKRRGEFRSVPDGVKIVPNSIFANCYLAYYLEEPVHLLKNINQFKTSQKDLLFLSYKENKDGLYERLFNNEAKFIDFISAFYLYEILKSEYYKNQLFNFENFISRGLFHLLSLFKIVFTKYCNEKFKEEVNISNYIKELYENQKIEIIQKVFKYINLYLENEFDIKKDENSFNEMLKFLLTNDKYNKIKKLLEDMNLNIDEIENLRVDNGITE